MKAYYGSRFSNNMTRTPDNFLVCHNVPIARTGWYKYLRKEMGLNDNPNGIVKVYRSPDDVFVDTAIASFEGKPVTDEHPPELLTPDTVTQYIKGAVQNVRRSTEEDDLLLADLIIYDKELIEEVLNGKREVSSGYDCIYEKISDDKYKQTKIRGNHVAVVQAGRAGHRVAIKDSNEEIQDMEGEKKNMSTKKNKIPRRNSTTTKFLAALGLKHFAMDADPEDIADAVNDMVEENACDEEVETKPSGEESETKGSDNPEIAALTEQVNKLTDVVTQIAKLVTNKCDKPEDALDEFMNSLENSAEDEGESQTIEDEDPEETTDEGEEVVEDEEEPTVTASNDSAATLRALKRIKPIIASIPDEKVRKKACDSLIKEFSKPNKSKGNTYGSIAKGQRKKATDSKKRVKTADEKIKEIESLGDRIAKKFNANCKEVK